MWHEARKIEKKIRGIMIDYRKRAERRTAYYQKMREDPNQLLRLHGNKCKLYIDSRPDKPSEESQLVPWQGDPNILIDRFDARSQLDYIPEPIPGVYNSSSENEHQINYERYRTLVQIEATGVTEESYLKQLAIEEWYGKKEAEKAKLAKEELSKKKASIGFKYDDSSVVSEDSDNSDAESDLSDIDISVNVAELNDEQRSSLDNLATYFGIADDYYCNQLSNEKKEFDFAKQLEEEEEERSKLSGRRGKRARRNLREKQKATRNTSPPSYAVRDSPTYDPYSPPHRDRSRSSSSRSPSPEDHGKIEYITEFGGTSNSPEKSKTASSREEIGKNNDEKPHESISNASRQSSETRSRNKHRSHRSRSRERSSRRRHGSRRSRSRSRSYSRSPRRRSRSKSYRMSRSRSRDRHRSRSRSYRRSRSRSRDRGRSRSRSYDSRHRKYSDSSRSRYGRRSRRSKSGSYGRSRSRSYSRSRSRSRSYSRSRSRSRSPRSSASTSISKKFEPQSSKKTPGEKTGEKPKLTPQERLKLRMQKQLSKQIKNDKQSEKKKQDEKEKERMNRDNEIYELQRKIRYRGRHDYYRERSPSPPPSSRSKQSYDDEHSSRSSSKSPRTRAYEEIGWKEY